MICTWAGNGEPAFYGDGLDRREAMLYWPTDLAFDPDGRAYVLDWQNHRVRRVNLDDKFETVIGTGDVGDGPDTGDERTPPGVPGTDCTLNHPTDVAFAPDGTVLLAAWHNHKVRRLDPGDRHGRRRRRQGPGVHGRRHAGAGRAHEPAQGGRLQPRPRARRTSPTRATSASAASTPTGVIDTVAGGAMAGFAGDGGPPLSALLAFQKPNDNPEPGGGLAIDAQDRLYIADTENHRIRRVDFAANVIETVAGNGTAGFSGDGGPATEAPLNYPRDARSAATGGSTSPTPTTTASARST